jgi:hypothetical protein
MNHLPEISDSALESIINNKVLVSDAAGMFKKPLRKNMKPYEEAAVRTFNRIVDEWADRLLLPTGNGGYIQSSLVPRAWGVYFEGLQTHRLKESFGDHLLPEKVVRETIDYLNSSSVDKIISELGLSAIQMIWGSLTQSLRYETVRMKRERIFEAGNTNDNSISRKWFSSANLNMRLMKGDETPYGIPKEVFNDIGEKIININNCIPKPLVEKSNNATKFSLEEVERMYIAKIARNTSRYETDAKNAYNEIVRAWVKEMLTPLFKDNEKKDIQEIMQMWACYFEGYNTHRLEQNTRRILSVSEDTLKEYLNYISSTNVEDIILNKGSMTLDIMWFFITSSMRLELLKMKREEIFVDVYPVKWWSRWRDNKPLIQGEVRPFGINVSDFNDAGEKVVTILSNAPEVTTPE